MALVSLEDGAISEKRAENETPLKSNADETGRVISSPAPNKARAQHTAKGKVKTSAMKSIEAEAETIGLPYLKARETITIENIGKKFSGNWRITRIRHEISSSGYICSLTLAKNNYETKSGKKANNAPKANANTKNNIGQSVTQTKGSSNKPAKKKISLETEKEIND